MADLNAIFAQTIPAYQRPEDTDFPVSKIRLFTDLLWQAVTGKALTEDQRVTLKELIDLLNLLDEHKHESQKELIAAMLPSISPLLEKMPTLGLTGTHVFTHLVPMYQLYLPGIERMVKDAHAFTLEETLLYYELTIFDHLFLVHMFEQDPSANMIELLLTIKAIILINALTYDYHQHAQGRSISFFTFLMRGGKTAEQLHPFLLEAVEHICNEVKLTVTSTACLETLEFLKNKLLETTQTKPANQQAEQQEETVLETAFAPQAAPGQATAIFEQATPLVTEQIEETPMSDQTTAPATPVAPVSTPPVTPTPVTTPPAPTPAPEPVTPPATPEPMVSSTPMPEPTTTPVTPEPIVTPAAPVTPMTPPVTTEVPPMPTPAPQSNPSPLSESPNVVPPVAPTV